MLSIKILMRNYLLVRILNKLHLHQHFLKKCTLKRGNIYLKKKFLLS